MKYHELKWTSKPPRRRVGRGISAGQGKTAGRGTKGQKSRAGSSRRPGFEGGQNPLMQRLPKLAGFHSRRVKAEQIYTNQLAIIGSKVDNFSAFEAGVVSSPYTRVKLIVKGEVAKKTSVHLQAASQAAIAAVDKAGGSFTQTAQVKRTAKEKAEATQP
jgi:large subunit ribosomal protein L15